MSEMPERKVLKEILMKLKTKSLSAESHYRKNSINSIQLLREKVDTFKKSLQKLDCKTPIEVELNTAISEMANSMYILTMTIISQSLDVCDNLKLYMDSLEIYSVELDKTLTDIFERAKKAAEEQIKQQEEILERKHAESYRV